MIQTLGSHAHYVCFLVESNGEYPGPLSLTTCLDLSTPSFLPSSPVADYAWHRRNRKEAGFDTMTELDYEAVISCQTELVAENRDRKTSVVAVVVVVVVAVEKEKESEDCDVDRNGLHHNDLCIVDYTAVVNGDVVVVVVVVVEEKEVEGVIVMLNDEDEDEDEDDGVDVDVGDGRKEQMVLLCIPGKYENVSMANAVAVDINDDGKDCYLVGAPDAEVVHRAEVEGKGDDQLHFGIEIDADICLANCVFSCLYLCRHHYYLYRCPLALRTGH
ncbi:hypothetical protein F4703DRAFT_1137784 [Phycomyces blakesleeanus]